MRSASAFSTLVLSLALAGGFHFSAWANASPDTSLTESESVRINAWFEEQYEELLRFKPIQMTFQGRKELNDRLDDLSREASQERLAWLEASSSEMKRVFDYALLDDSSKLSWKLWERQYEVARNEEIFFRDAYLFDQMFGLHSVLPMFLINFHKVDDELDYLAYITRLSGTATLLDQAIERARASARDGIRPPKFVHVDAINQSRKVVSGAPFDDGDPSALWSDLQAKAAALVDSGAITVARADTLKEQARHALIEHIQPAYARVIAWSEEDLPNALENPAGVGTTHPNGAEYYAWQLRQNTTTDMSAEDVHQLGLREVARLRAEMEDLVRQIGFEGDLPAFAEFINTDPSFRFSNTDVGRQAYIDEATATIENIQQQLPNYFGILPKADLVVRRVESFREQAGGAGHYYPGTPDGSRPGIYYAHLLDMSAMPKPELEVIAYHEGLPGHHLQISIAQELQNVPTFRTQQYITPYMEGWGLYSELLAKEMPGTYRDPYSDYGRLTSEMWRAIRLVVDTGLHAKGWTERQAVAYFRENSSLPQATIESEVRRYLILPGQATAYKVGMIRIQELRRSAEAELGDGFDIRAFHDLVLGGGAMPLDLLELRVDQWIAEQGR